MTTFAERFRQQGVRQGEAAVLIRQLRRKFGELPEDTRRQIETADAETLLEWSDRILMAGSIAEVMH